MILANWTRALICLGWGNERCEGCISGETKSELINRKKKKSTGSECFLFTYLQSISFVRILMVGNAVHLLTWDDKEEGLEKLPDAAVQEPRGVWLVNIDKRQQHVLTRDLCLPVPRGLCLREVVRRLDWHLSGYTVVTTGEHRSLNRWESLQNETHTEGFFRHAEKTDVRLNRALCVGILDTALNYRLWRKGSFLFCRF